MKLTLKTIIALMAAMPLQLVASPISSTQAQATAEIFLNSNHLAGTSLNPAKVSSRLAKSLAKADKPFYIFNREGGGFVIVSGDDRLPQVLGYSLTGSIDVNDLPSQLDQLLAINADIVANDINVSGTKATAAGTPIVSPLLGDITWSQGYPFNEMCPTTSSSHYYVGCVATAATQIMRYYNYPTIGSGSKSYTWNSQTLSADFGATTYDWANMPAIIPDAPTDAQVAALSTLAYHFGVAVEMEYMDGGSGAYTMLVPTALRDYFGYDSSVRMHSRDYYDTNEWMTMIKTELNAGHPVYYSATSEDLSGGHAFVCDGYDDADYVHINWGWNGSSNGYYLINHLDPSSIGTGGGSGGYNVDQEIITGFAPAGTVANPSTVMAIYGATRLTGNFYGTDCTLMTYAENLDTRAFDGTIHAVLADNDGNIVTDLRGQSLAIEGFSGGRSGATMVTMRNVPVNVDGVADGNYQLRFAFKASTDANLTIMRHPEGLPSYMDCSVKNGVITSASSHQPTPKAQLVAPITAQGEVYANASATLSTTIANLSTDYGLSSLILRFTSATSGATYDSTHEVSIYNLSTEDVNFDVTLDENMPAGDYYLTVAHSGYESEPFDDSLVGQSKLTVLPERTSPVIRFTTNIVDNNSDSQYRQGETIMLAMKMKNFGAAGSSRVVCRISPADNPDKEQVLIAGDLTLAKGETATKTIYNTLSVDPGEYVIRAYYLDGNSKEQPAIGSDDLHITVTANDNLPLEAVSLDMPTQIKLTERVDVSLTVKANARYSGYIYVRLRQFTNSGGEIVYMGNNTIEAGETKTVTTKYRPGVADGLYMPIVEARINNSLLPLTNRDAYYREVTIGESAGVDNISADNDIAFSFDGTIIVANANDPIVELSVYDLNGRAIASTSTTQLSVEKLPAGLYIVRVVTSKGSKTGKIIK
jgi:hypothetical protein